MSVYIKGMEIPKSCAYCYFKYVAFEGLVKCDLAGHDFKDYRETWYRDDCPLIPVPDHGRLIDADALMAEYERAENSSDQHGREFSYSFRSGGELCTEWWPMHLMLQDAPTIIPASKEDGE